MTWLHALLFTPSVAQIVIVLSVTAALGLALGNIRVRGVGLGIGGVLFSGLFIGHLLGTRDVPLDEHTMEFVREFGLILFVYAIGIQVGPGFFASLRREGLPLNLMAASVVLLGALVAVGVHFLGSVDGPVVAGLFSGATTNTPSLAAAQQALKDIAGLDPEAAKLPGLGYAVAYPFGIIGIIATMLLVRAVFRVDIPHELAALEKREAAEQPQLSGINLEVRNTNLDGLPLSKVPTLRDSGVVISRLSRNGRSEAPTASTILHTGDLLHAVGPADALESLKVIVGAESAVDVRQLPGDIGSRRILVTNHIPLGKTVGELDLVGRYGVNVTRINRAGIDIPPRSNLRLQFADSLVVVGPTAALDAVAREVGDSQKELQQPHIIPIFVGIALGVILGSMPIYLPGMPAAVKLGLAGGPLLVAIALSRLGNVGRLVWFLPLSANTIMRELGIVLFLGAVGLRSGDRFIDTLTHGDGLYWMAMGAIITLVPLLVVAFVARVVLGLNYLKLCGLLAGSMTDPPALAFAHTVTGSHAPATSYATVYPLVMILRVLAGQLLVMLLAS